MKPTRRTFKLLLKDLEKNFPGITKKLSFHMSSSNNLSGMGQNDSAFDFVGPPAPPDYATPQQETAWYDKAFNFLTQAVPAYFTYETQKDVAKIQIERAKQGLPPIDMTRYGAAPITVRHQVDPGGAMSPETKNMLWIGGGIIAAIFLLPKLSS